MPFPNNDNPADDAQGVDSTDTATMTPPDDSMDAMGAPGEIAVPLDSLSEPDEQDQMVPPEIGDKGQANIEFTVSRVDGQNAYITLDAVNGKKVGASAPNDAQESAQLQQMAQGMPEKY